MRPAEGDRRRVGLERGIRPVPLILHLEQVAFELEAGPQPALELDLQPVVRGEERPELSILDALRADPLRQRAGQLPVRRPRAVRAAGVLARVENAEADPVVLEVRLRDALEPAVERAVGSADELAAPVEAKLARFVKRVERDTEGVGTRFDLQPRNLWRDRSPGRIPDRDKEAAHDLDAAEADVAEVDPLELRRERPCPQLPRLCGRLVAAVPDLVTGGLAHREGRSYSPPL